MFITRKRFEEEKRKAVEDAMDKRFVLDRMENVERNLRERIDNLSHRLMDLERLSSTTELNIDNREVTDRPTNRGV